MARRSRRKLAGRTVGAPPRGAADRPVPQIQENATWR
jgi:hypothetical protein